MQRQSTDSAIQVQTDEDRGQYRLSYRHPCVEIHFGDSFSQYVFFIPVDDDSTQCYSGVYALHSVN